MLTCQKCKAQTQDMEASFCAKCGTPFPEEAKIPYVGEDIDRGFYRITYAPVEGIFNHMDAAKEAARHSAWNEDTEFGDFNVEKKESTVTSVTHPYICGECKKIVSSVTKGKCAGCGAQNWQPRK